MSYFENDFIRKLVVRCDDEFYEKLTLWAKSEKTSLSEIVRRTLREGLEKHEDKQRKRR